MRNLNCHVKMEKMKIRLTHFMMLLASVTMETAAYPFLLNPLQKLQKSKARCREMKEADLKPGVQLWWCDLTKGSVCYAGNEAPTSRSLISEFIRPLQISGDKPELLSVKPTFLTRSRAGSPARAFLSEVSNSDLALFALLLLQIYGHRNKRARGSVQMFWLTGAGPVVRKRPQTLA